MDQWLRLQAPNAGGLGSIPARGSRSHMLQLKILHVAKKVPRAKTQCSQIKSFLKKRPSQNICIEFSSTQSYQTPTEWQAMSAEQSGGVHSLQRRKVISLAEERDLSREW